MKILNKPVVLTAILVAALALASAPRAAAQTGTISGQIMDINAKPWAGLTVQATSEQGAKSTAKTDNDGKYSIAGLRPGVYMVIIAAFRSECKALGRVDSTGDERARREIDSQDRQRRQIQHCRPAPGRLYGYHRRIPSAEREAATLRLGQGESRDRKSTRLNSSHSQ